MRHGQTFLNRHNRIQGWIDSPLTTVGESEAYRSGLGLVDFKFDEVITSDMLRTVKTAKIALRENNYQDAVNSSVMSEFREFFFGSLEGRDAMPVWAKAFDYIGDNERTIERTLNAFHAIDPASEAENYEKFWGRIEEGLNRIIDRNQGKDANILIVTHALTIDCMMKTLFPAYKKEGLCENASLTKISHQDGEFKIHRYNDCSHFAPEAAI